MNTKEILQGIKNWTAGELDTKVDKVTGKGLSANDYTDSEKSKLAGIASGAEVNVQSDWNATEGDAFIKNKPTIPAAVTESTVSGWGFTKNTGTVTGVKINGTTKEPSSGVVDLGTVITAHQDISGKVDKTTTVNGHALSDNVSVTKSDVGLGNVGNFKAVSTVASQGLSDTEKSNARSNIGAGTSSFSGSYNDLTDKPTIPSVGNAEVEIQKNGTKVGSFTTNQSGSKVAVNITVPTGTAANKDVPTSGNASTSQVVMGNDSRLTDSRNANDVYSWAKASSKPTYTASEVGAIPTSAKGAASGVATLDSAGKVPSSQLPSYVDDVLEYDTKSAFPTTGEGGKIYVDKSTNTSWRWSGSAYTQIKGDLAIGTTTGTAADGGVANTHYNNTSNPHSVTKAQVGLGSVVNTGDSATPVSGGTTKFTTGGAYTELNKKVDKVSGKGLSTNDYTTDEKTKLGGIASGAEVNQNAFSNVGVKVGNTTTTVAADAKTDTVTLIQGSNVTLTTDTTNDTITIAAKDTTYSSKAAASGGSDVSLVTTGEKYTWNNKSNFSGSYNDLTNKPTIPSAAKNGTYTVKTLVGSTTTNVSDFTANQSGTDDVTFVQGSNVTITPDATNRKITIAATDTKYTAATAAPGKVATSSAQGSSTNYARQDHTHGIDLATGDSNGQVKIAGTNVSVKGLGSAAYTASSAYAASQQLASDANLNNIKTVGFYNAGGGNTITNKPSGVEHFGMEVIHYAAGDYYVQIVYNNSNSWRRRCDNNTWGSWVKDKLTDTTYSAATTSAAGLMSSNDKTKLNGIATGATKVTTDTVSGWGYTKNAGTVTGVKMNGTTKSPSSGVVDLGTVITSHQDISGKVNTTTTVNGHALSSNVTVTKSDVGLGSVGNFKAVSTAASQGLTDTEKSNARANIGAGTSSFSGSYNDLSNKPTIPTNTNQLTNGAGFITSSGSCASASAVPWTGVTNTLVHTNEFNFIDKSVAQATVWFNYRPRNSDTGSSTLITDYKFGDMGSAGGFASLIAAGFKKSGSSDSDVLLGGGGHASYNFSTIAGSLSKAQMNAGINNLETGSSAPTDNDYFISQYAGGGSTYTSYRRPVSALWSYMSGKGDSRYLQLTGGTMTGAAPINFTPDKIAINFRPSHATYNSKMEYMTSGNEAMVWANHNAITSFIFKCGLDIDNTNDWTGITPSMQIKGQSVYINSLIKSNTTPSYNLYVNGTSFFGDTTYVSYSPSSGHPTPPSNSRLIVGGNVAATGGFNNFSDVRYKNIIEDVSISIKSIANAPIFKFSWLDPDMPEGVNVGTSAQYWQTIIPEIVSEANDDEKTLSMQYGVAGLVSSVALAKKVVEQEETIKAQEARIKALEDAIANIQNMLNK